MRFPLLLALVPALAVAAPPKKVVREEKSVTVDGRRETWRLEWQGEPKPFCMDPADAPTAPCERFAYGEEGVLDLVRLADGREIERLPLTPLFRFGPGGEQQGPQLARMRRWPWDRHDESRLGAGPQAFPAIRRRPQLEVLQLEDLDGDGRALEWILTVDAYNSSMFPALAIELDRATNRLRPISTVESPQHPLVLTRAELWRTRKSGGAVALACGDHGADVAERLKLSHDEAGWHATRVVETCDDSRRILKSEPW